MLKLKTLAVISLLSLASASYAIGVAGHAATAHVAPAPHTATPAHVAPEGAHAMPNSAGGARPATPAESRSLLYDSASPVLDRKAGDKGRGAEASASGGPTAVSKAAPSVGGSHGTSNCADNDKGSCKK